ncbi:MAG TPA: FAD-dependent monooxygenase [Polyangiaceae bacterium]|nr:FAD-dependent monooxygenase [Polyangiaceae bacterium]
MRILISGASIAGPVLAYWLQRYGFQPTLVERAPGARKTGGHAVDLFSPSLEIVDRMGLLPLVQSRSTGTDHMTLLREGPPPVEVNLARVMAAFSDRHLEILRDELSELLHGALGGRVETRFGDSIRALRQDESGVDVDFEHGPSRRFELVIGADGLHSAVRRLVFGPESDFSHYLGAYLAVLTLPNHLQLSNRVMLYSSVRRVVGLYSARNLPDARAVFFWRSERPLPIHHRDVAAQKQCVRDAFAGLGWELPRLLAELESDAPFYFDSITQLRMDSWSHGRVTLAGDAGYCPGPAVGGSTTLAVVGAYVLAGELAVARGDHALAFPAYEAALGDYVQASRAFALQMARQLIPDSRGALWLQTQVLRALAGLPQPLLRALSALGRLRARLHDTVRVRDYSQFG